MDARKTAAMSHCLLACGGHCDTKYISIESGLRSVSIIVGKTLWAFTLHLDSSGQSSKGGAGRSMVCQAPARVGVSDHNSKTARCNLFKNNATVIPGTRCVHD